MARGRHRDCPSRWTSGRPGASALRCRAAASSAAPAHRCEKQQESETKFNEMLAELSNATTRQMGGMQQQIVMLGKVAGQKMLDMEGKFEGKLSESIDAIVMTQKRAIELGTSQERAREREGASI